MPTDPVTGQQLPYPGEPGYEEALAANPEAYAQEGAMPPEADAMPPEEGAMPPEGPGPSPDDVVALEDQEAMMQQEMMGQAAPEPESPFNAKAIGSLIDEFNSTLDAFAGGDIPDVEWDAPEGETKWDAPLPPEIYVPLIALNEALKMIGDGEFFDKYGIEPETLTSDAELRKVTANLKKMGKDKKLVEAMQAPIGGEMEEGGGTAEMPPAPGTFNEDEQLLAANLS